ncbi:arabinose isomerase [Alkalihalobacillus pseudalcaliphilus]|nr:arabinose isomerase [Alkalihalobacillus pseudalcaliphilus]
MHFWFVAGSQHLYGSEALQEVSDHAQEIVQHLNSSTNACEIVLKETLTTSHDILQFFKDANADPQCAGIITWMHTFSPAKMWIAGLNELRKPLLHLHTQYNRDIPWQDIDMDFMNLNQSAHGDREYGFITARMNINRKVIVGHWQNAETVNRLQDWLTTAVAYNESKTIKVARFGDNMRNVAVTEGDKIEAQIRLGWTIDGYGIGDLVKYINQFSDSEVDALYKEYAETYIIGTHFSDDPHVKNSILEQARIELGLKTFLDENGYTAFTTTFEDLYGMKQLPGLAVQRLMEQGYGFAGEGDWKTAALVRMIKQMTNNQETSFMEDYTYHFNPQNELVLGSHMLEVCPTIANEQPRIEVHPLSIGNKEDPARLVFNGKGGPAINASLIDLGHRFRLILNEVEAIAPTSQEETPKLPVAKVLWSPKPSLSEATEAWIYAGGAHHTVLSFKATKEQLTDWAELNGIECVTIDKHTDITQFRKELKWNEAVWGK